MPRTRTTKKLAQRIDLNYFQRPHPLRQWRFRLSLALVLLGVLVIGWHAVAGDRTVYSSGQLAPAHAILTARCEVCHVRPAGAFSFSARTSDAACLACHDGPPHHSNATFTPTCASCHVEHRGAMQLAATADASCTQCHGDLHTAGGATPIVRNITGFTQGHPEFAVLRAASGGSSDPTTIKLNHYRHLQANLAGPNGPVQIACQDCHRTPADTRGWRYGQGQWQAAVPANADPLAPRPSAAYMAPPSYAKGCAGCHTLQFDKRFAEGVPHDQPEVIHGLLVQKFRSYISSHPGELREPRQPDRDLPGKPLASEYRTVSPDAWVVERTAEAEQLLWGKTCKQCHTLAFASGAALPKIAPSNITARFMPRARFDHSAHQLLNCASCHVRASSSQDSADLLLPGIATCQQCHKPEARAAESRCFECHTYHDQSQRHPAPGSFTLPDLLGASGPVKKVGNAVSFVAEK